MDGVQRNFSMMAEKIDRMRCLRERCDNYVRLIKLTLDETIKEQNSLLDGSAIHNRLKYLGVLDKPKSLSNTFNTDKYHKNIDFNNKYKYLVFDDDLSFRQHKNKSNLNKNDMYLSNYYSKYKTNYEPQVHDFSAVYDNQNNPYYMPINHKKYRKPINFRTLNTQEYQVYYFPTSNSIPQYPRQTTEGFYRRKPIKQYPEEEVPYWPTRYPKPVRVVEREPSYSMIDYGYRGTNNYRFGKSNFEPYSPEHRTRYYPTNDNNIYRGHDDSDYYYEPHMGQRSFSSITRPCSPVYNRDILYDRTQLENSSSLLEKKIRDYVWNPHKERVEKYMIPSYENTKYYTDFKPLNIKHKGDETFRTRSSLGLDSRVRNQRNEIINENAYNKNSILTSPERKFVDDEILQSHKENDHYSEYTSNKKKTESPSTFPKRISFDLGKEYNDLPTHINLTEENTNENYITKDHKLVLERKESITKIDDKRRKSLLPNDDYSVPISKQRISPSNTNVNSRRQSLSKQEKLASIGNSFESETYLNSKNNYQGNDSSLSEKNVHFYNNDRISYDNNNDIKIYSETQDDKNNVVLKNENTYRDFRRDSNDNSKKKSMETTDKTNFNYQDHAENSKNLKDKLNATERRESYKGSQKFKIENTHEIASSNDVDNKIDNEYNNKNSANVSPKNKVNSPITDQGNSINNIKNYNMNEYETDQFQQFTNINDSVGKQNNSETIQPYNNVVNDSNDEIDNTNTVKQVNSDYKTTPKDQDSLHEISNIELTNNTNYYQDHSDDDHIKEHQTHGYDTQPEHVTNDDHFYPDEIVDNNKRIINNNIEPNQQNKFDDENNVHDEYYYQNPANDKEENLMKNQYENPDSQVNNVDNQNTNDDYYYQNYSNADPKEQQENQYSESGEKGEYAGEHAEHDDYYYQNHARDDIKEQHEDQRYVDSNYQGDYVDQTPAHDDYYYQDYSNVDPKVQPENQYAESDHQGEYVAEQMPHDDYYYQNHPEEGTNESQVNQHYQEHQGNYINEEQDNNYYYENNPNVNIERHPEGQYDEHAQQETYAGDHHANDGYYYQEGDTNYNESVSKEQYDGYVDSNHDANAAYYPESNVEHYDQQQHEYENNSYPTQKADYIEPYEQNSKNENNDYSENVDGSQPTSQIANEQK
ncbi:protein PFF0380w-like [Melanaphis sacchari]|uniref:protein PFF0380w-like n=1 Tax=Melanaphis sacchari TaxID=742174 RepID=UPI000DC13804|nr:protein PFF0380w-like [Melanaphis sacchari]